MHIDVHKPGVFSSDVVLSLGTEQVGLAVGTLRERTAFTVGGVAYDVRADARDGVVTLTNTATGLPEAQLTREGLMSANRSVEAKMPDGSVHVVHLAHEGWLKSRYMLRSGGVAVGEVRREGILHPKVWAEVPAAWPLPVAAFVVWAALRGFHEQDGAAAA